VPLLTITTNTQLPDSPDDLLRLASQTVASLLGKPERYVMVQLNHNPLMAFAGDTAPLAYLELKSIGLPGERTADFSRSLCDLISQQLRISPERVYIEFSDAQRHLWGWNGATF